MIDSIRKKHEAQKMDTPVPYLTKQKSSLTVADVDALFAELDEAESTRIPPDSGALLKLGERLTHLLDEDEWNNLEPLLLAAKGELDEARGKVEKAQAWLESAPWRSDTCKYNELEQILKGGGDDE